MNGIDVHYQGQLAGRIQAVSGGYVFQYDAGFIATGHELSPFHLPLRPGLFGRDGRPSVRLPGLFEDSLPDAWGRRVIEEQFRALGRAPHTLTPIDFLEYLGARTMGALTYTPAAKATAPHETTVERLQAAAVESEKPIPTNIEALADLGSSAGGARPKALVGLPRTGGDSILVAAELPPTHEAWLIKFDTSRSGAHGPLEQAYALMARAAGIDVPESRLLRSPHPKGDRWHFAVKRFDREGAVRIHHHTLAGLTHTGGGDLAYETLLRATRQLTKDDREVQRAYHRAVFNVIASNRDDHGKNHGFLYRHHRWTLGPAYDLTFLSPAQLPERGLSMAGERANVGPSHLRRLAATEGIPPAVVEEALDRVRGAVSRFRQFADEARVPALTAAETESALRDQLQLSLQTPGWRAQEGRRPRMQP